MTNFQTRLARLETRSGKPGDRLPPLFVMFVPRGPQYDECDSDRAQITVNSVSREVLRRNDESLDDFEERLCQIVEADTNHTPHIGVVILWPKKEAA